MTDLFLRAGLSNACLSLAIAVVAMAVGAKGHRPNLAHMLWVLVFVKLLTPPVIEIPLIAIPAEGETRVVLAGGYGFNGDDPSGSTEGTWASSWPDNMGPVWNRAKSWLGLVWLGGSVVVLVWSLVRVFRFAHLLTTESEVASPGVRIVAEEMAGRLGLKRVPAIHTTLARISPLVWWAGGRVRIVLPAALLEEMNAEQSQWILTHELAHVQRRDYVVRWLEWLACVCFWWNPVIWWAQRNLRATEEICCDELVIGCLNPKPLSYANSLLSAVEFLACPAFRPPATASEINSGGCLERRFKMIVSGKTSRSQSQWLHSCVLMCAIALIPLGLVSAQDYKAVEKRLVDAVIHGELSLEQAGIMMGALRKAGGIKKDATVKSGELTKKKAAPKMSGIKKQAAKPKSGPDLDGAKKKLEAMVEAGQLTKEQAAAKMLQIKKAAARPKSAPDLDGAKKKLEAMIKSGKLTKEQAAAKMSQIKKAAAEKDRRK